MKNYLPRAHIFTWLALLTVVMTILSACGTDTATPAPANTPAAGSTVTTAGGSANNNGSMPTIAPTSAIAAATATNAPAAATPTTNASQPAVTLTAWHMPNGPDPDNMFKIETDAFHALNPNITVEQADLDWGVAYNKILTSLQSGDVPDITQVGTTWQGPYAAMGGLHAFTDDEIKAVGGKDAYLPSSWGSAVYQNKVYGIPWFVDTRAIFYRTDIFKKANIDPDAAFKDWASFKDAVKKISDSKAITATIIFPGKNDWNVVHNFAPWVWEAGGDYVNADGTKAMIDSPESIKGAAYWASLAQYGTHAMLEKNSADIDGMFSQGVGAIEMSGPWVVAASRSDSAKGGWAKESPTLNNFASHELPPGPSGQFTFAGGSNLTIPTKSKHPAEAFKLLQYLTTKESQLRYAPAEGFLPALNVALADPKVSGDPMYKVFVSAAYHSKSYPTLSSWGAIEDAVKRNVSQAWDEVAQDPTGDTTAEFTPHMQQAAKDINAAIASNK